MNRYPIDALFMRNSEARQDKQEYTGCALHLMLSGLGHPLDMDGPWLAGGSIRRVLYGLPQSDFDWFFKSASQHAQFTDLLKQHSFVQMRETEALTEWHRRTEEGLERMQVMHFSYYDSAPDLISSFDYTLTQFAFDGSDVTVGDYTLWDVACKRININLIQYPVSSARRLIKYANQGYSIPTETFSGLLKAVIDKPDLMSNELDYEELGG